MTKTQREELDLEIKHIDHSHEWKPYNRRSTDGKKWVPWLCAALFVPIAIITGAEILYHFLTWVK